MTGKQPKRTPRPGIDEYGRILLHEAARDGNAPLVQLLLAAGADPNAQDDNGWSPLHFAAQAAAPLAAEALLASGARTDLKDSFGNTPLWRAVMCSRTTPAVVKLLVAAGADPMEKNNHGVCPKSLAESMGSSVFAVQLDGRRGIADDDFASN